MSLIPNPNFNSHPKCQKGPRNASIHNASDVGGLLGGEEHPSAGLAWGGYSTAVWATNFLYIYRATESECVTQNSICSMLGIIWMYVLSLHNFKPHWIFGAKISCTVTQLEHHWNLSGYKDYGLRLSKIYPMIRLIFIHAVEICPFQTQHESVFLGKMFLGNLSEQRFPSEK